MLSFRMFFIFSLCFSIFFHFVTAQTVECDECRGFTLTVYYVEPDLIVFGDGSRAVIEVDLFDGSKIFVPNQRCLVMSLSSKPTNVRIAGLTVTCNLVTRCPTGCESPVVVIPVSPVVVRSPVLSVERSIVVPSSTIPILTSTVRSVSSSSSLITSTLVSTTTTYRFVRNNTLTVLSSVTPEPGFTDRQSGFDKHDIHDFRFLVLVIWFIVFV